MVSDDEVKPLYGKRITLIWLCILFSVSDGIKAALLNSLIKYIAKCHTYLCIRIGTLRNTVIQFQANLWKNDFQPNIEHAQYNTFTVFDSSRIVLYFQVILHDYLMI